MRLVLTLEETRELKRDGVVDIVRNGYDMHIEECDYNECGYTVYIMNPYDNVILAKEPKEEKKVETIVEEPKQEENNEITIIGAEFEPTKMHTYDVKTHGKHPVHVVEGGAYITEDERIWDEASDCGWFWLNEKEYQYFKSQCKEIKIAL